MTEMNAFENNEQEIPEVKEQVVDPVLDAEIAAVRAMIEALRKMGLHRTADNYNTRTLTRLLAQRDALGAPEG